VKLLGALGAWRRVERDVPHVTLTAIAGGVVAIAVVLLRGSLRKTLQNIWLLLTTWRVAGLRPVQGITLDTTRGPKLAYAIPIALGALATLWLR
jgi:prepilin peptidase CpaA